MHPTKFKYDYINYMKMLYIEIIEVTFFHVGLYHKILSDHSFILNEINVQNCIDLLQQ